MTGYRSFQRNPRLCVLVMRQALLTPTETDAAVHAIRHPKTTPVPEAVEHYGGPKEIVKDAIRNRARIRAAHRPL